MPRTLLKTIFGLIFLRYAYINNMIETKQCNIRVVIEKLSTDLVLYVLYTCGKLIKQPIKTAT
tara:strand:+ start:337 stop:525 length:189 start_codon:yes stop_codon:yes gene_type:complete